MNIPAGLSILRELRADFVGLARQANDAGSNQEAMNYQFAIAKLDRALAEFDAPPDAPSLRLVK